MSKTKLIILIFIFLFTTIKSFPQTDLNSQERAFISNYQEFIFTGQTFYPPFEFFNPKHNEYSGMTIELIRWIAAEFGFKARFVHTHFKAAQENVLHGQADVITSFFYSRERNKQFDFTSVIFNVPASIFVKADRTDIKDFQSLENKTIAFQEGDYVQEYIKAKNIRVKKILTRNFAEAVDLVIQGKADAAIGDEQIILFHLYSNNLNHLIKRIGEPLYSGLNCMAVKKGKKVLLGILNKGIEKARLSGTLDKIVYKWLGRKYDRQNNLFTKYWTLLFSLIVLFLLLVLVFWFWNFNLKKQVNSRTIELQKELTERKIAEEKLHNEIQIQKALLSSTPAVIYLKDNELRYSAVNKAFCDLVRLPENYLIGKTDSEIFPQKIALKRMTFEKHVIDVDMATFNLEEPFSDNYMTRWFLSAYVPYHDKFGKVLGLVCVSIDITQRKQYEQERELLIKEQKAAIQSEKKAQKEMSAAKQELEAINIELKNALTKAEEANRLKSEFLAIMSHELRTPLAGMLGFSEILAADDTLTEKQKHYSESIFRSGKRLLAVLSDLLEISVIEAGKIKIEHLDFMVLDVVNDVYILLKEEIDKKNIQFSYNLNGVNTIRSDPSRIRQILLNLIGNAVKFTDEGSISVEVSRKKNVYEFSVTDTGIGINEDSIAVIFDMFRQVENPNRRKYQGTGLGLAICKRLVEAIGGEIHVQSIFGKGSTFTFTIPAINAPTITHTAKEIENGIHSANSGRLKVFFAEDDESNFELIKDIIAVNGKMDVEGFKNGNDLIDRLSEGFLPDIILMDIEMPVMSGIECLQVIKKLKVDVPVIALTAYAMKSDKEKFLNEGFTDFLSKPISQVELFKIIEKHCNSGE